MASAILCNFILERIFRRKVSMKNYVYKTLYKRDYCLTVFHND